MKKNRILLLVIVFLMSMACNMSEDFGKSTPTSIPSLISTPLPTITPTLTATPTIRPPGTPEPGLSNVYGRVLWRGKPVSGFKMQLLGPDYFRDRTTNSEGLFAFGRLDSGKEYTLRGVIGDSELNGIAAAYEDTFVVPPNTNFNYGEYWLLETDLVLLDPAPNSETDETHPSFRWEAYPGAAYYTLSLFPGMGKYGELNTRTDIPEYTIQTPLQACYYYWDVIAFNETGVPLARSNSYLEDTTYNTNPYFDGYFKVVNDEVSSCIIKILSPGDLTKVSGSQLVFKWETHPLVVRYHLSISHYGGVGQEYVIYSGDFIVQDDGSIRGPDERPTIKFPGHYQWLVIGYDKDGNFVAGSSFYHVEVTIP